MSAKDATLEESITALSKSTGLTPDEIVKIAKECNSSEELVQIAQQLSRERRRIAMLGDAAKEPGLPTN